MIVYPDTVRSSLKARGGCPLWEGEAAGDHSSRAGDFLLEFLSERLHLVEQQNIDNDTMYADCSMYHLLNSKEDDVFVLPKINL